MRHWIDLMEQQWPERVTNAELTAFNRDGDDDAYHADDDTVYFDGRGATLVRVAVAGLVPGNDVDPDIVEIYAERTTEAPPVIIDGNTVENGNHRLAAAKARGEESILAYRLDETKGATRPTPSSDAFRSWFKHSKVVTPNGEPMICYHGSSADITAFRDITQPGNHGQHGMAFGQGYYFTDHPARAKPYAKGKGANITPVYLSMQNPKYYQKENWYFDEIGVNGFFGDNEKRVAMTEKLKSQGYDGMIIGRDQLPGSTHEYVAFYPHQIKSIYSAGFNPNSEHLSENQLGVIYQDGHLKS